jgi:DNA-binding PadR family transcriptional regulator
MSGATLQVLSLLVERPTHDHYGLDICRATHLKGGTVYPILARLEKAGWVDSTWESIDPKVEKRHARRNYRLTSSGREFAREALEEAQRTIWRGWQPAPGMPQAGEAPA